jgi:hypothetical protein
LGNRLGRKGFQKNPGNKKKEKDWRAWVLIPDLSTACDLSGCCCCSLVGICPFYLPHLSIPLDTVIGLRTVAGVNTPTVPLFLRSSQRDLAGIHPGAQATSRSPKLLEERPGSGRPQVVLTSANRFIHGSVWHIGGFELRIFCGRPREDLRRSSRACLPIHQLSGRFYAMPMPY